MKENTPLFISRGWLIWGQHSSVLNPWDCKKGSDCQLARDGALCLNNIILLHGSGLAQAEWPKQDTMPSPQNRPAAWQAEAGRVVALWTRNPPWDGKRAERVAVTSFLASVFQTSEAAREWGLDTFHAPAARSETDRPISGLFLWMVYNCWN